MRKYLLPVSLMTCVFNVTLANQSFALTLTNETQSEPPTVTLYAAGSLRGALTDVANAFSQEYGIPVKTEFASSGSLRERLENGEQADVFASADTGNAIAINQKNLSGPVLNFTSNPLYAIASSRVSLTTDNLLDQFLNPNVKLGIAQPVRDPLGDYAIEIFRKADQIRPGSFELLDLHLAPRKIDGTLSLSVKPKALYLARKAKENNVALSHIFLVCTDLYG